MFCVLLRFISKYFSTFVVYKIMFKKYAFLFLPFAAFAQDCKRLPAWVSQIGFDTNRSAFSTSEPGVTGIAFIELAQQQGAKNKVYQHPSWLKAGNMGAVAITENGSIYATPTPKINLLGNRPDEQNILWRINPQTQIMEAIANLPAARPLSTQNPYGLMGLVYDCDTRFLYAASLAGSDKNHEAGRIFILKIKDPIANKAANKNEKKTENSVENLSFSIQDTLANTDAIGIGLYRNGNEKRLFYGKTRSSEVFSVQINTTTGKFEGAPRLELSLEGLGARGDDRAKKIRFDEKNEMTIKGISFFYNLSNPANNLIEMEYKFRFVAGRGWVLVGMQ